MATSLVRLFLLTDRSLADTDETLRRAALVLERAGDPRAIAFGVRDHDAPTAARLALARALVALARRFGARVVVHDRIDVALASGADGVHLAERSVDVLDARALLGPDAWLGRSCHDAAGLMTAREQGASAVTLSPLFASPNKGEPLGRERFTALRALVPELPVIALGGVDASNAHEALSAGATGVAVIRAWLRDDPTQLLAALARVGA